MRDCQTRNREGLSTTAECDCIFHGQDYVGGRCLIKKRPKPRRAEATTVSDDEVDDASVGVPGANAQSPSGYEQQAELDEAIQSCTGVQTTLESTCNPDKSSWISDAKSIAGALAAGAGSIAGMQDSCSKMQGVSQALNGLVGSYNGACTPVIASCTSACDSALTLLNDKKKDHTLSANENIDTIRDNRNNCGKWNNAMADASQNLMAYQAAAAQAKNCELLSKASSDPCADFPNSPLCQKITSDCNDPVNATSVRCICVKNPSDPVCGSSFGNSDTTTSTASNKGTGSDGFGGDDGGSAAKAIAALDSGYGGVPVFDPVTGKPTGVASVEKGGGRGAPGGGGGGNAAYGASGGGGGGGRGGGGFNTSVYGGLSGSSGGRYGIQGGSANAASGVGNYGYGTHNPNARPGMDLKAYLPGGKRDPNRGLAGFGGVDGITGANGLSIWQKASRRYNIIRPQMKD